MATATLAPADLGAELRVLEHFDAVRSALGHDYGCGQRAAEISRRDRELRELGRDAVLEAAELTAQDLRAAFERIGEPRLRRIEREDYRRRTDATRRTIEAWRRTRRVFVDGEA